MPLTALLLAAGLVAQARGLDGQERDPHSESRAVMKSLSVAFRGLEQGFSTSSVKDLASSAAGLRQAAELLPTVTPEQNEHLQEELEARSKRLLELSAQLEAAAVQPSPLLQELFEDVRTSCVACHVVFRQDNSKDRFFPARGNTISGMVNILSTEKVALEDHANVVVFLEGVEDSPSPPSRNPVISQKNRRFVPRVQPIVRGTSVDFPNDDDIFHNAFSLSKPCCFDLGIYEKGSMRTVQFPKPGLVKVHCNLHPEMVSNILVLNNPHFAVSNARGFYLITGVPDGEYVLRSWHEFGDETRTSVAAGGGRLVSAPITVQESKKLVPHSNKFGKPYKSKY